MCLKIKNPKKIIYYSGKFQMFYQKAAVMGTLVLKSGFFRFYAPPRIPYKRNACKAMLQTWLWGGKILELPEMVTYEVFNFQTCLKCVFYWQKDYKIIMPRRFLYAYIVTICHIL